MQKLIFSFCFSLYLCSKLYGMDHIIFTSEVQSVLNEILKDFKPEDIFVLTDVNTSAYCLPLLGMERINEGHRIVIEEGEAHKSLESAASVWQVLSAQGGRRGSVLVNVGGGLVTDIGGFAASCFKRGIKCINIPTTLLAQVDASVGGKTGINFNGLKNEIGTFALPLKVVVDTVFLKTLPESQLLSGFGEMLKHALLAGGEHFCQVMETDPRSIDWKTFPALLQESVGVKYAVVRQDPRENGIRKVLNFGHTIGHAIESAAIGNGENLSHGAAVAYGIMVELYLSVERLGFDREMYEEICWIIRKIYPPYKRIKGNDFLYELMLHDKKNEREGVNFTLLREPGTFSIDNYCTKEEIGRALEILD